MCKSIYSRETRRTRSCHLTSSSRNNDASRWEIDGREGVGGGRGGGVGVLRWWTVLMVPMRLGDVLSIDLE